MDIAEWKAIKRLNQCTFRPGSYEKRFVRDMAARAAGDDWYSEELTEKQKLYLGKLMHHYRRQLSRIPDPLEKSRKAGL